MNEPREVRRDAPLPFGHAHDRAFCFTSPHERFVAPASATLLRFERRAEVATDVARALAFAAGRGRPARVAGALPFDGRALPHLRLYEGVDAQASTPTAASTVRDQPRSMPLAPAQGVVARPTPKGYVEAVAQAVARIRAGELDKVVLARSLELALSRPLPLAALLARLAASNPSAYVFACDVSRSGAEQRLLVGASPELLVEKRGAKVASHPLAGSLPRSADASEDAARAARLAASAKNQHEHALVVEAVADTLAPYCRDLTVPAAPALVRTDAMWHLGTRMDGVLRDPEVSSLALAMALHPTPAVAGVPQARALEVIPTLEGFDRGYFAGAVGHCDRAGDGAWAVSIRCCELTDRSVRVFAGAGIVGDSVPEDELAETSAKLRTMLRALGFDALPEPRP